MNCKGKNWESDREIFIKSTYAKIAQVAKNRKKNRLLP